ncbi:two-component system regulatory protein YycI [Fredinandcohnia humi]
MDWSNTKTLFIITFLILNIFLGLQLVQKKDGSQLDLLTELSVDEKFAQEEITYRPLPKEPKESSYISGKIKIFSEEDVENLKNQDIDIATPGLLKGVFQNPIKLSLTDFPKINQFVRENMIFGDSYAVWDVDEESKTVVLFQQYKNRFIFNTSNISGLLILDLNDKNEVISYQQTLITDVEEHEGEELITPIQTLEMLFNNDHLKSGSNVTKVEIGYYPLVPFSESQLLAPTWHIVIDEKTDIFVNAIEGQIIKKTE